MHVICLLRQVTYFNPRTREGCDAKECDELGQIIYISIHAPVKGATWKFFTVSV